MGFNTTVVVLNDALDCIAKDPNFGQTLADAIRLVSRGKPVGVPASNGNIRHCNAATVIETHHADGMMVVAIGANCGRIIGYAGHYTDDDDKMIKELNRQRIERERAAKKAEAAE